MMQANGRELLKLLLGCALLIFGSIGAFAIGGDMRMVGGILAIGAAWWAIGALCCGLLWIEQSKEQSKEQS